MKRNVKHDIIIGRDNRDNSGKRDAEFRRVYKHNQEPLDLTEWLENAHSFNQSRYASIQSQSNLSETHTRVFKPKSR